MKTQKLIEDAAHMLVSAQCDVLNLRDKDPTCWPNGFYKGKRAAAKFVLKQAVQSGAKKQVARAIREWVDYHKKSAYGFLPAAVG